LKKEYNVSKLSTIFLILATGPAGAEQAVGQFACLRQDVGGAGTGVSSPCNLTIATSLIPAGARLAARVAGSAGSYNITAGGIRYDRAPRSLLVAHPQGYVFPLGTTTASGSAGASAYSDIGTLVYPFSITHVAVESLGGDNSVTLGVGTANFEVTETVASIYNAQAAVADVTYVLLTPRTRVIPAGSLVRAKTALGVGSRSTSLIGLRGDLPVYSSF
jgi:hypothetical protein